MFEVKLPGMDWFENGNVYTGSLMTDPKKGIMNQTTLEYRVQLLAKESEVRFCAACRFRLPWGVRTNIEEYAVAFFEGAERGRKIAENWISRQAFIPDIKQEEIPTARRTYNEMLKAPEETSEGKVETDKEEFLSEEEATEKEVLK